MSIEPLALVVEVAQGFAVCDSRRGELIVRRQELRAAAAFASLLNGRYPAGSLAPAPDTLAHEVLCAASQLEVTHRDDGQRTETRERTGG